MLIVNVSKMTTRKKLNSMEHMETNISLISLLMMLMLGESHITEKVHMLWCICVEFVSLWVWFLFHFALPFRFISRFTIAFYTFILDRFTIKCKKFDNKKTVLRIHTYSTPSLFIKTLLTNFAE